MSCHHQCSRASRLRVQLIGIALLFGGAHAHSVTIPTKGLLDGRVRTAAYNKDQVYRLRGAVGYQIDIEFEPGESFLGLGSGDIDGLSFVAQDNHLFIKPRASKVSTNLTVLTSRRSYQFEYFVLGPQQGAAETDAIYSLRFSYPHAAGDSEDRLGELLEESTRYRPRNIDYWYCGNPAIKPTAVSDDGVHTRLRFGAKSEQPAIFIQNDDGTESLVNFSMQDGDVIVHRVVRRLVVRRGKLTGCIVNKAFVGTGERLQSGTISPSVERTTQGMRP